MEDEKRRKQDEKYRKSQSMKQEYTQFVQNKKVINIQKNIIILGRY